MSSAAQQSTPVSDELRRPFTDSASEFFALLGFVLFFATVITVAANSGEGNPFEILAAAMQAAAEAGKYVLADLYEFLMALAGILLGLFALSVGGQLLGPAGSAERTRRVLGWTGEVLAVLSYLPLMFVVVYCFTEPSAWASMLLLVPEIIVVTFLALQLAAFIVWEPELRRSNALAEMDRVDAIERVIPQASRRAVPGAVAVNAVAVGVIIACIAAPRGTPVEVGVLAVGAAIIAAVSSVVDVILGETAFATVSRAGRRATLAWIVISALLVAVLFLPSAAPFSLEWSARMAFVLGLLLPAASAVLPLGWAPSVHQWTLRGAASRLARRSLRKSRDRAEATVARFEPVSASGGPAGKERLRAALRRLLRAPAKPPATE